MDHDLTIGALGERTGWRPRRRRHRGDRGRAGAGAGTHTDLLAAGGRCAELYHTQFEDDPPVPLRAGSAP